MREVLQLPAGAPVVVLAPRSYRGAPIAASEFAFSRALEHTWPLLRGRTFLLVNPWLGRMTWDGAAIQQENGIHLPAPRIAVFDWHARRFFELQPPWQVDEKWWPLLLLPLAPQRQR